MNRKRVLVTGSSGFIGKNLWKEWAHIFELVPVSFSSMEPAGIKIQQGDVIVHLAGIAHQKKGTDPELYYEVNYRKAVAFARHAKAKGAAHFIYISSTKVYGKDSGLITESTTCEPADDYGKSKWLAEQEITALSSDDFLVSVIRPPLVYGPGVKGNMLNLLKWAGSGKPFPFKGISNPRTVVHVSNLLALLRAVIDQKSEGIFIPADDRPLSTFEMLTLMKQTFDSKNKEIRVPGMFISIISKLFPKKAAKVFGSLLYHNESTIKKLNYTNPYSAEQGFRLMTEWYKQNKN